MSSTRRNILTLGGSLAVTSLAGCFGSSNRSTPDDATISIQDEGGEWWAAGKTLRVVVQSDTDTVLDESFTLPIEDKEFTVEPATYSVQAYLDGEQRETNSWEVTHCQRYLYVTVDDLESNGIQIHSTVC